MDLLPTEEQDEIVAQIRTVLEQRVPLDAPVSDAAWATCAELGWFGLGIAEASGGVGYSVVEECLLFEQLGAACAPGPFLGTVIAAHVAVAAASSDGADLAHEVMGGAHRVALADPTRDGEWSVIDGDGATLVVMVRPDGASIHRADGIEGLSSIESIDELVAVGRTPSLGEPLIDLGASALGTSVFGHATLLVAAYLAGNATATTAQSTQYAKDREQFGQPIGSFQAVKHRCADMATRAEAATAQCRFASLVQRDGRNDAGFHAHAARVVAASAATTNAHHNIQNHGGIGFTWEHTAHRYLTRARIWSQLVGEHTHHLAAALAATAN